MAGAQQDHRGSGDNVGRDKHVHYHSSSEPFPRSKYLNAFAHYELTNLVGREDQLKAIQEHFQQHNLLLLQGLGGIGKTTLARAYLSQVRNEYDHLAYVEIVSSIAESMLLQLGSSKDVDFQTNPELDTETNFAALIETLRHYPKLLLVLDNANDTDDLRQRKSQLASLAAKVLITGRAKPQSLIQERTWMEVPSLTPEEALGLFVTYYTSPLSELESQSVQQLLRDAFYHPKLIEVLAKAAQANAFLSLEDLQQLVSRRNYEDEELSYPIEIDNKTKAIYRILLDLFDTTALEIEAQQLLLYFAIFPTIDIPVQDLATMLQAESSDERKALSVNLDSLAQLGWLESINNRSFSIHGLVQWVVRQRLAPTATNCEKLIGGLANVFYVEPTENPLDKQRYLPYTTEWLTLFADQNEDIFAVSYNNLATIYGVLGLYEKQFIYTQKAVHIREAVLSTMHPDLARSYNNLAGSYNSLGEHQQALAYYQKALNIFETELPSDDPDLARCYNNIAHTYRDLGDYQQALDNNQKALTIWKAVLPANHPDLARSYNNLALTYGRLGDHQQALKYNQKAVAIWKAALSPTHPEIAQAYNNLGYSYGKLENYQQAIMYFKKALDLRKAVLPSNHPQLANSYSNLAGVYGAIGDHQTQLDYNKKALTILKAVLSSAHPDLAQAYHNIAYTYRNLGNYSQSLAYNQKAVAIREAVFPSTHSDLALSYYNLAIAHWDQKSLELALDYMKKVTTIHEQTLSPTHPDLIQVKANLVYIQQEIQNRSSKAN